MGKNMYKVKEFCRLTNLSRKSLLIYEKINLLSPEKIEEKTGYRFYSDEHVAQATRIAFLKNFNIPLNDMATILSGGITLKDYFARSHIRLDLINQQIKCIHGLLSLKLCENEENFLSQKITVKTTPELSIISMESRGKVQDVAVNFMLFNKLLQNYGIIPSGPPFTYYYPDCTKKDLHFKIGYPVLMYYDLKHHDIVWEKIPPHKVATLRNFGGYELLPAVYQRLMTLTEENRWERTGEFIETYVLTGDLRYTDSSSFITDVAAVLR